MLAGEAAMRASLSEERAGQVSNKCEGDSTPRLQSLQVASPGVASNQAQRKIGPGRNCMRMRQNSQKTWEFGYCL